MSSDTNDAEYKASRAKRHHIQDEEIRQAIQYLAQAIESLARAVKHLESDH